MVIRQGDLIWVQLPAGRRPAVVIQGNAFNTSRINTVIVAAVTSSLRFEAMPGNVALRRGDGGIPKASVINVSQLHSIDRQFIIERIGTLPDRIFDQVREGLKLVLDMR